MLTRNRGIYVRGFYSFKNIKIQIKEPVRRKFNIKTNQITSFKEQLNYNVCKLLFKKSTNIRFKIDVQKYIMTFYLDQKTQNLLPISFFARYFKNLMFRIPKFATPKCHLLYKTQKNIIKLET